MKVQNLENMIGDQSVTITELSETLPLQNGTLSD